MGQWHLTQLCYMYKAEEPYQSAAYTIHTLQAYLTLSGNPPLCFCIKLIKISRVFVSLSTLKFCCCFLAVSSTCQCWNSGFLFVFMTDSKYDLLLDLLIKGCLRFKPWFFLPQLSFVIINNHFDVWTCMELKACIHTETLRYCCK